MGSNKLLWLLGLTELKNKTKDKKKRKYTIKTYFVCQAFVMDISNITVAAA